MSHNNSEGTGALGVQGRRCARQDDINPTFPVTGGQYDRVAGRGPRWSKEIELIMDN